MLPTKYACHGTDPSFRLTDEKTDQLMAVVQKSPLDTKAVRTPYVRRTLRSTWEICMIRMHETVFMVLWYYT